MPNVLKNTNLKHIFVKYIINIQYSKYIHSVLFWAKTI